MSTKIYNGFKLKGFKSLDRAFHLMAEHRANMQAAASNEAARMLAERACTLYDELYLSGSPMERPALAQAYDDIDTNLLAAEKHRAKSYYDLDVSVALASTSNHTVIGILFCGNDRLRRKFFSLPAVVEYGYWDNSDPPEDVSNLEWNKRRGQWNEVLRDGIPAQEMFNMVFVPEYRMIYPPLDIIASKITQFDKRLQVAAEKITMRKVSDELQLDSPGKLVSYRMSGDFDRRVEEEKPLLASKLKPTITIEDLTGNT